MKWEELPLADRAQLMAAAVRNGYTDIRSIKTAYANFQNQRQQTGNRYDEGGEFEVVNPLDDVHVDDQEERYQYFRQTLPENLQDDSVYRLRRAWELNGEPRTFSDAIVGDNPMFSYNLDDRLYHGNSVAYNPDTDEYEFLKPVDHDTVDLELMQYFNNPELEQIRQNYQMDWDEDRSRGYYKYIPRTDDNALAYGGNLFKTGGNKDKKSKTSSSQNSTLNYIAQQLEKRGVPKADALAVAANIMVESKGNPEAVNPISGAKGLVQYLGSRKKKVKSWAMDDQLDQIAANYNKLGGDEWLNKDAWKRFNETTDVAEKARLFRRYWERPEKSSWNDTDKYLGKHSNLPQEVNDLVAQVSNLRYDEPKAPVFTPADQKLLETSPLVMSDPDYPDPKDNTFINPYYEAAKLDSSLDREPSPMDQYVMLTSLINSAQQDDNSSWFDTLMTYSPKVTPRQREAAGIYRLFNTSGEGGQLYHGLNFAAYGGKVNRFDDGGNETQQEQILGRMQQQIDDRQVYNNYEDAVDASSLSKLKAPWTRFASSRSSIRLPALGSNCTLNATQWVNPRMPIMSAATIEDNPNQYGYTEIPEEYAVPGDLVIADNDKGSYHTMMLSDFVPEKDLVLLNGEWYSVNKGDPLVTYSRGKFGPENLVYNAPLAGYIDQSEGKTDIHYYRHPYEEGFEGLIPPLIVTPQGAHFDLTGPVDRIKYYMYLNR